MKFFKFVQGALLALWLGAMSLAYATPPPEEQKLIATLIQRVETMNSLKFVRNGAEYPAAEAAKHMRAKYDHFKDEITSAEDFIARCATRSEMTKLNYKVKLAGSDGLRDSSEFLLGELKALRQRP